MVWDGPDADYTPFSDDLPWCMVPEKKITVEDVKYVLSSHYQGTPYDPYASYGDKTMCGAYRSIGINRNDVMALIQMRPEGEPIQWLAFASNAFNVLAPLYTDIDTTPELPVRNHRKSLHRELLLDEPYDRSHGRCFL